MQNQQINTDRQLDKWMRKIKNHFKLGFDGVFVYLLLLTVMYFLLEISFFIQCNSDYLSDYTFVSDNLSIPYTILPGIIFFVFAQLFLRFSYCVMIWIVTVSISHLFHLSVNTKIKLGISIWFLGIISLIVTNAYLYPNSKFSLLVSIVLFNHAITKFAFYFFLSACLFVVTFAVVGLAKIFHQQFNRKYKISTLAIVVGIGATTFIPSANVVHDASTTEHPNIIVIGVDSLRPDFLSYFGHAKTTPFFDAFLNQATVFSESITPLARTFPSWTGILTGQYPRQIGVRYNLASQHHIDLTHSLPNILRDNGYETIYATDETRFSNLDKNYGFNEIVTPPMGLNDFLLGTFNDFVMSNMVVNTALGKWLFPHSYANRPVYYMYEPDSFLKLVQPVLQVNRDKPLFLAIHFCLPHYPYLWAGLPANDYKHLQRYEASIERVDKQLRDFFVMLKQANLLDHAIVVMLSDHGEALELPGDRITENDLFISNAKTKSIPKFYPPSLDDEKINQSAGHGTDVLGLPQYHTLLAFKLYGLGEQAHKQVPGVVSLLDVTPTILDLLHIPLPKTSGESLAAVIKGRMKSIKRHHFVFLESDFTPEAIRTVYPEERKAMLEGIDLFQIDAKTTRLTVKPSMGQKIINSKQLAVIDGHWMLALYPQNKNERMPILINLVTGEWTNDLHTTFAKNSPAQSMLQSLKAFYGDELSNI